MTRYAAVRLRRLAADPARPDARSGCACRRSSSLRVSRRRVLNGQAVTFRGRLRTMPVPPGGKLVELQVRLSGRWQTFRTTRTDQDGALGDPLPLQADARRAALSLPRADCRRGRLPVRRRTLAAVRVRVRGL